MQISTECQICEGIQYIHKLVSDLLDNFCNLKASRERGHDHEKKYNITTDAKHHAHTIGELERAQMKSDIHKIGQQILKISQEYNKLKAMTARFENSYRFRATHACNHESLNIEGQSSDRTSKISSSDDIFHLYALEKAGTKRQRCGAVERIGALIDGANRKEMTDGRDNGPLLAKSNTMLTRHRKERLDYQLDGNAQIVGSGEDGLGGADLNTQYRASEALYLKEPPTICMDLKLSNIDVPKPSKNESSGIETKLQRTALEIRRKVSQFKRSAPVYEYCADYNNNMPHSGNLNAQFAPQGQEMEDKPVLGFDMRMDYAVATWRENKIKKSIKQFSLGEPIITLNKNHSLCASSSIGKTSVVDASDRQNGIIDTLVEERKRAILAARSAVATSNSLIEENCLLRGKILKIQAEEHAACHDQVAAAVASGEYTDKEYTRTLAQL